MGAQRFVALLTELPLGTRVVIRYAIESGMTDVIGYIQRRTSTTVTLLTRKGERSVELDTVRLAKVVPEPPDPRKVRA
ncbi:hypothetical protein [Haematomicrobium sanguinis]|uniref:putative acetyltransferase n=1 Tax=Haematomicrobium sanguinis TaxID=479106 RepID=UPI00047AA0F8|nr:hypothetical protein [Haematomicrobium sanguinis]